MDREALTRLAESSFATQRISTQDVRDIVAMLNTAEQRAKEAESRSVDRLLNVRRQGRAVAEAREVHQLASELIDRAEALARSLDTQ